MSNYTLVNVSFTGRTELHDLLKLTGTEISINTLTAGANVPFVHQHTKNEEVYIIIEGQGLFYIDGEEKPVQKGDCLRIAPKGARGIAAAKDAPLCYICVQAKADSLEGFTMHDGVLTEDKPSWLS